MRPAFDLPAAPLCGNSPPGASAPSPAALARTRRRAAETSTSGRRLRASRATLAHPSTAELLDPAHRIAAPPSLLRIRQGIRSGLALAWDARASLQRLLVRGSAKAL